MRAALAGLGTAVLAVRCGGGVRLQDEAYVKKAAEKMVDIGKKMEYMLNTGNLVSRSGLDLSQSTGFTVVAEKLNYFRCRGCGGTYQVLKFASRQSLWQGSPAA